MDYVNLTGEDGFSLGSKFYSSTFAKSIPGQNGRVREREVVIAAENLDDARRKFARVPIEWGFWFDRRVRRVSIIGVGSWSIAQYIAEFPAHPSDFDSEDAFWECNRPYYEGKLTCNSCDAIYDAADDNEAGYCPQCLAEAQADTNPDEAFDLKGQRMERKSDS